MGRPSGPVPLSSPAGAQGKAKDSHVSIDAQTTTHTIVDGLIALLRKPAGSVAPNPGARIPAPTAETWPVGLIPANGKSSSRRGKHSCGMERRKSVSASNDLYIAVRKCSRSSSLPGSGDLRPACTNQLRGVGMPARHQHARGTRGQACSPHLRVAKGIAQGVSAASPRRSNVGRPISDGKGPRPPLPPSRRGLTFRLLLEQTSAPHAAELLENRSQ